MRSYYKEKPPKIESCPLRGLFCYTKPVIPARCFMTHQTTSGFSGSGSGSGSGTGQMTWMHEDTHFNPKSLNICTYCKMLSKLVETFAHSAQCFQRRLKPSRALQNTFRTLGNGCALCEMSSKAFETFTRSAQCLQRRLKPSRAPQNAFKGV